MGSFYFQFTFGFSVSKANCYGDRWTVERAFESFNILFGEHLSAKTFWNMSKEVKIKWGNLKMLLAVP
jgi:hypothetical protein